MSILLYIKANPKPQGQSRTFEVSDYFVQMYQKNNPGDEIVTLDLMEKDISFLTAEELEIIHSHKSNPSHPFFAYARQLVEADKYLVACPLWNLGVPAVLKAYFDYVCVSGITFEYQKDLSVGLLKNKKMLNIIARGGKYDSPPMSELEMGSKYIVTLFQFLGVSECHTIAMDGLDLESANVQGILANAKEKAAAFAKQF